MPRPQSNFRPAAGARPAAPVAGSTDIYHGAAELREGLRIRHPRFLNGVIERIDTDSPDTRIEVSFDDGSRRTLLLKFARFTILD